VAVDGPEGAALLAQAVAEHANNVENAGYVPFRDSRSANLDDVPWWLVSSPHGYLDELRDSGIAVYAAANWDEAGTKHGAAFTFGNLDERAKLIFGPAGHCDWDVVQRETGFDIVVEELRFFDHWLKGIDNGITDEPAVRYYMMASARTGRASDKNGWRTAEEWPPTESTRTRFYFQPDGGLSTDPPTNGAPSTTYAFDPADPVPTLGGLNLTLPIGPMDQREVGERSDYLRFQTEVLSEDLVIAGKIDVALCAATDGPDTDSMVKLVDVYPDGYEALVIDSGIRTRYRHGLRTDLVEMMTPGEPTRLEIDLWNSAITFEAGHRIAVHVTSSNYPRFDVNPNTGEAPGAATLEPRIARNTVYHSGSCASAIILPVMPG
jgi:putative CocE/NonD family hydrolase